MSQSQIRYFNSDHQLRSQYTFSGSSFEIRVTEQEILKPRPQDVIDTWWGVDKGLGFRLLRIRLASALLMLSCMNMGQELPFCNHLQPKMMTSYSVNKKGSELKYLAWGISVSRHSISANFQPFLPKCAKRTGLKSLTAALLIFPLFPLSEEFRSSAVAPGKEGVIFDLTKSREILSTAAARNPELLTLGRQNM